MNIKFILNGEDVTINCDASMRLIEILRGNFGLLGTKSGCLAGQCGACSVVINGQISSSCLIPAFKIRGSEIVTIEGFSRTVEYEDIVTGFQHAHLGNCGYCESGKILCAEAILGRSASPSRDEILLGFSGIKCRCTNPERLIKAVTIVAGIRQRRLLGSAS